MRAINLSFLMVLLDCTLRVILHKGHLNYLKLWQLNWCGICCHITKLRFGKVIYKTGAQKYGYVRLPGIQKSSEGKQHHVQLPHEGRSEAETDARLSLPFDT